MTDTPKPTLSDLIRSLARRDRLVVGDGATTVDVNTALRRVRDDRDVGQPGSRRLVRNPEPTPSDLLRKWRDLPDDDEGGA
jgi:hypothetical protein